MNAPPPALLSGVGGVPAAPAITWENGRIAAAGAARGARACDGAATHGACRGVRYFTGRWYATRYRSAGITTSAVSTGRPEAK